MTDEVFDALATLRNLRYVAFHAMTKFSFHGILKYISGLSPSNAGLLLQVLSQDADSSLSASQQQKIRQAMTEKVDGGFDFMLYREGEEEFDSDSD